VRTLRISAAVTGCLLAAVAALPALTACGDDASADPGKVGDKQITVYSGRAESLVKPLIERFAQERGIKVHTRYSDTAQLAAQLGEEGSKSPADVFLAQDAGALGAVTKQGLFATLDAGLTGRVPEQYRARDNTWVGVTGRSRTLVYNVDTVPAADLPTSVFEMTDPKWKGRFGVAPTNASFQAFITGIRVQHGEAKAADFLRGLKDNDAQIRPNNVQIVADVNDGKLAAGLVNHYYAYELAHEKGVAADALKARNHFFRGGDPGALVNVSGLGVLKKAAQDPDAQAFADYLLGSDGQTYFANELFEYPLITGVTTAAGLPAITTLDPPKIDLNDLNTLEQTVKMIKEAGLA
jgi:iron(III) transport system substrate-binding protein